MAEAPNHKIRVLLEIHEADPATASTGEAAGGGSAASATAIKACPRGGGSQPTEPCVIVDTFVNPNDDARAKCDWPRCALCDSSSAACLSAAGPKPLLWMDQHATGVSNPECARVQRSKCVQTTTAAKVLGRDGEPVMSAAGLASTIGLHSSATEPACGTVWRFARPSLRC